MKERKNSDSVRSTLMPVLVSSGIGSVIGFLLLMMIAGVMTFQDIPISLIPPLTSVCIGIGALIAGFSCAKMTRQKGMIMGCLCGLIIFFIVTLIGIIIGPVSFSAFSLIKLVIMVLFGAIGGILGINMTKKRKFI